MVKTLSEKPLITFNDPIHGTIQFHWILKEIINTPEFQRLHHIKQLSSTFHVYPEAQHSRFGHSIGTAHLAGKLVKHLQEKQPELGIDRDDVLCVQIAGLCHDLGHGPYSHLFDDQFLPMVGFQDWRHEDSSCRMFDSAVMKLKDKGSDEMTNFFDEEYCKFIKEMIDPSADGSYRGKNHDKEFLFQIISNKTSGVDVDKWDYFARDCHHLGIANGFDHERYIKFTKVMPVYLDSGKQHICVAKKEAFNLYGMFQSRLSLHKRACQHKRKNAIDHMICDALEAANEHIPIKEGVTGITNCIRLGQGEDAFIRLDDRILLKVEQAGNDAHPNMRFAKNILSRISNGDHYINVAENPLKEHFPNKTRKRRREKEIKEELEEPFFPLRGKLRVTIATFNYGNGKKDPIEKVWFYDHNELGNDNPVRVRKEDISIFLPSKFEENKLQVFCTDKDECDTAKEAFQQWISSSQ